MDDSDSYEVTAAGKQVASIRVYKDEEDREVLIAFTDGTELAISMEVRSVTSATLYKPSGYVPETLVHYKEPPSQAGPFSAVIRASTKRLE